MTCALNTSETRALQDALQGLSALGQELCHRADSMRPATVLQSGQHILQAQGIIFQACEKMYAYAQACSSRSEVHAQLESQLSALQQHNQQLQQYAAQKKQQCVELARVNDALNEKLSQSQRGGGCNANVVPAHAMSPCLMNGHSEGAQHTRSYHAPHPSIKTPTSSSVDQQDRLSKLAAIIHSSYAPDGHPHTPGSAMDARQVERLIESFITQESSPPHGPSDSATVTTPCVRDRLAPNSFCTPAAAGQRQRVATGAASDKAPEPVSREHSERAHASGNDRAVPAAAVNARAHNVGDLVWREKADVGTYVPGKVVKAHHFPGEDPYYEVIVDGAVCDVTAERLKPRKEGENPPIRLFPRGRPPDT